MGTRGRIYTGIPSPGGDPSQRRLNENGLTLAVMKKEVLNSSASAGRRSDLNSI